MLAMLKHKWFEDCFKAMIKDDVIEIITAVVHNRDRSWFFFCQNHNRTNTKTL